MSQDTSLNYTNPPVAETVLSVQFDPLQKMKVGHFGAFWKLLGSEWTEINDASRIEPQFETFDDGPQFLQMGIELRLSDTPPVRLQIKNKNATRMVQIQNDRFVFNWTGTKDDSNYPRYQKTSKEFFNHLNTFQKFLKEYDLGEVSPTQWEVTYVNYIPIGTVWKTPVDWAFFKPMGNVPEINGLTCYEGFNGNWQFLLPESLGRLHVFWKHGYRQLEGKEPEELIRLDFLARGSIEFDREDSLEKVLKNGIDLGHEAIVKMFCELMSDSANTYWGLEEEK